MVPSLVTMTRGHGIKNIENSENQDRPTQQVAEKYEKKGKNFVDPYEAEFRDRLSLDT
jgi:hypothetical protein